MLLFVLQAARCCKTTFNVLDSIVVRSGSKARSADDNSSSSKAVKRKALCSHAIEVKTKLIDCMEEEVRGLSVNCAGLFYPY